MQIFIFAEKLIVYFNYESNSCSSSTANASNTMVGFDIVASGPSSGSDFILIKLKNNIFAKRGPNESLLFQLKGGGMDELNPAFWN